MYAVYRDGGSLQDIVQLGGCEDEGCLASIAKQALIGLWYLHATSHLHRDLKPGMIILLILRLLLVLLVLLRVVS